MDRNDIYKKVVEIYYDVIGQPLFDLSQVPEDKALDFNEPYHIDVFRSEIEFEFDLDFMVEQKHINSKSKISDVIDLVEKNID